MNNPHNKEEFEIKLKAHLEDIRRLYKQYYPKADYLTITYRNGKIYCNNRYWGEDSNFPINIYS